MGPTITLLLPVTSQVLRTGIKRNGPRDELIGQVRSIRIDVLTSLPAVHSSRARDCPFVNGQRIGPT